jgi:Fe-S cluster biosynthesis and repair protein YggX
LSYASGAGATPICAGGGRGARTFIIKDSQGAATMAQRMVKCVKFGKEMPGLDEPPFDTELGQKIYEQVSAEAWRLWGEHAKMVINEYRLNPADKKAQEIIIHHMEQFFFGEGAVLPPDYVPPQQKQ